MNDVERAARWRHALDALEARAAEATGGTVLPQWTAPADLGPIPADLHGRVEEVLRAQHKAIDSIRAQRAQVSGALRVSRKIPVIESGSVPVYVDRSA